MDLSEIREKVREHSGNRSFVDARMDQIIRDGQSELLDIHQDTVHTTYESEHAVTVGDWSITVTGARIVLGVWREDADGTRVKVDKLSYEDALKDYPDLDGTDRGAPAKYVIWPSSGTTSDKTIKLLPPSDDVYTVIVLAKRFMTELASDSDENYWSVVYPNVLINAALYQLYVLYGRADMARLKMEAVEMALRNLAYDIAEEETAEDCVMER